MSYAKKAPMDTDNLQVSATDLGTFEPASPSMPAVLLQTGVFRQELLSKMGNKN